MIRKITLIGTVLIPLFCFSQKYFFTYEYTLTRLPTFREKRNRIEGLLINKNESTYISLKKVKRDSVIAQVKHLKIKTLSITSLTS
ncbi:hypothetical protein QE422_001732 [Chryseobacterium sp. SORGH_AS 447]|nr:hypothetical protein [Chryseobacterium sp. SORGH_AS_0447]